MRIESAHPYVISSLPPRFLNLARSGLLPFASLPQRSSRTGSRAKSKVRKSYSGLGCSNTRYFIVDSASEKSAGLVEESRETITFIQPLAVVPFGAVAIASLPYMNPGKNGLPLLTTPPYIFFNALACAGVRHSAESGPVPQLGTSRDGSKSQRRGSSIRPSARPAIRSHLAITR